MTQRKSLESVADDLDSFVHDMREDGNDASSLWLEYRVKAIRRLAAQDQKPVALAHVSLEDDGLFADLEVLDGTNLQPSMSPVALYLSPPPAAGWDGLARAYLIGRGYDACRIDDLKDANAAEWQVALQITKALRHNAPPYSGAGKSAPATIPTCCVTGAIPGDGGACGDCDPCILGEPLVPESVKSLIAEKNSLLQRVGEMHELLNPALPDHGGADAGVRDILAAVLFAKWSGEASGCPDGEWFEPDWGAWRNRTKLNPFGLSRTAFEEEADFLLKEVQPALSHQPAPVDQKDCEVCGGDCASANPPVAYCPAEERKQREEAVAKAREMLELGINIQATGDATNAIVTGVIKSLLDHIDDLDADLKCAVAVGRMAARPAPVETKSSDGPSNREETATALEAGDSPIRSACIGPLPRGESPASLLPSEANKSGEA